MRDYEKLVFVFVGLYMILQAVFYKEGVFQVFRLTIAIMWIFVLPGYVILNKLAFVERVAVGSAIGLGVMSIASYYIGLIGVSLSVQVILLPILVHVLAFAWQRQGAAIRKKLPRALQKL